MSRKHWMRFAKIAAIGVLVLPLIFPRAAGSALAWIDVARGHYEVKRWGMSDWWLGGYRCRLWEKYGVRVRTIADCQVDYWTVNYGQGYNEVSKPWLQKKYGKDIFKECNAEALEEWKAQHPDQAE